MNDYEFARWTIAPKVSRAHKLCAVYDCRRPDFEEDASGCRSGGKRGRKLIKAFTQNGQNQNQKQRPRLAPRTIIPKPY